MLALMFWCADQTHRNENGIILVNPEIDTLNNHKPIQDIFCRGIRGLENCPSCSTGIISRTGTRKRDSQLILLQNGWCCLTLILRSDGVDRKVLFIISCSPSRFRTLLHGQNSRHTVGKQGKSCGISSVARLAAKTHIFKNSLKSMSVHQLLTLHNSRDQSRIGDTEIW